MMGAETKYVGAKLGLERLFATPTTARLLAIFALEPERTFIQRELVERSGGSLYLVQRDLKRLESIGLIHRTKRGRQVEYRAANVHPAFPGLQDALLKTVALADRLRDALSEVPGVLLAFIFGSLASGEEAAESDLDILVLSERGTGPRDVAPPMMRVLRELGREPNLVVMSREEFAHRLSERDHFLTSVLESPRTWLVGDDEQLALIAQ